MKVLRHFSYRSSLVAVLAAALALGVACSDDDDNGGNGGHGAQEGVSVVDA